MSQDLKSNRLIAQAFVFYSGLCSLNKSTSQMFLYVLETEDIVLATKSHLKKVLRWQDTYLFVDLFIILVLSAYSTYINLDHLAWLQR